MHNGVLIKTLL